MKVNIEAEHQVLAGMMNNVDFLYDALSETHEAMFNDPNNKELYKKIIANSDKSTKASILSQTAQGKEKALIKTIDGLWIDVEHSRSALENLRDAYIKRQLQFTLDEALKNMDSLPADDLIANIEKEIGSFYFNEQDESIIDPEEYAVEALGEFYELLDNPDKAMGIPFSVLNRNGFHIGFPSLDATFNGAQGGDLIMIAAKTGHGKTAMAISIARIFSILQNYAGYYENTEMRLKEMIARLIAPIARVDVKEILNGRLTGTADEIQAKKDRIVNAYEEYRKSKLYLSRIPSLPVHKAKALARQVKNRFGGLDYLIVDYIGRMTTEGKWNMQTWDEYYEITKQLKELAMTLNIPIFILAQLNDEGKVEGAKKMKNECDGVLFFQPIEEKDEDYIRKNFREDRQKTINYKIVKEKVRRDDNPFPIYVNFDKKKQFINEVAQ